MTLFDLLDETTLSKLGTLSREDLVEYDIKVNGKYTNPKILEKLNTLAKAITETILEYLQSQDKKILHRPITLKFKPTILDDLQFDVTISDKFKNKYNVSIIGNTVYVYDHYENVTISIVFKSKTYSYK